MIMITIMIIIRYFHHHQSQSYSRLSSIIIFHIFSSSVLAMMKIFIIFRFLFSTLWTWDIVLTLMQTIFRFPFTTLSTWAAVSTLTATSRFQIAILLSITFSPESSPDCFKSQSYFHQIAPSLPQPIIHHNFHQFGLFHISLLWFSPLWPYFALFHFINILSAEDFDPYPEK